MDFTDDECCTHSDLLDMIFDMSDLNIDQFDVNFGLAIFISYGQFASTATWASSSSTSRNFLCRLQLRGDSRKRCCMPCLL
jgi:hypothetical protein